MSGSRIKVCIHCLTYNHEAYIAKTLDGFVMQKTDFPFMAVVIDDCSTDLTASIVRDYEKRYPDIIKGIYLEENYRSQKKPKRGFFVPFDQQTEYIAICEGDDYWTDPNKLQKQVNFLDAHPDYGLCYTDFDLLDESSNQYSPAVFENGIYKRPTSFEDHLVGCGFIAPMSWVYRKSVFESLEYKRFTDATFSQALAFFKQSKIHYLPEVTCVYRAHPKSLSRPTSPKVFFRQYKGVFDTQMYFAEKYQVSENLVKLIKSGSYVRLLPSAIQSKQSEFIEEAASFFKENNINFDEILKLSKELLQARQDGRQARKTHAYRIGKAILKPVERVKRIKQLFK